MESEHRFERIVGGTQEEKWAAWNELQRLFESKSEDLQKYELEKTEQDVEIIEETTAVVDQMIKRWDGDPKPLPIDKIHILKPSSIKEISKGALGGGMHQPLGSNIGVEKKPSSLEFANTVAHELFHAKSYKVARIGESPEDIRLYRSGISMFDRKTAEESGKEKEYFGILEEAIVAESTKKFFEKISERPVFKKEAKALETIAGWIVGGLRQSGYPDEEFLENLKGELKYVPNVQEIVKKTLAYSKDEKKRAAYAAGWFNALMKDKKVESWERYYERKELYKLMDEIVAKSGGQFTSRNAVFDELAKANYSGKYFRIARIIEGILGKGSFRQLAEKFSIKKE